ncbi:MFS transporter [Tenacibaculum sp. M341]|nr:MFS transporter [Tenacibaculum sp. M341]TCI85231.1 MFS transporter [Tenacibaculum sp. M341]
MFSYSFVLFNFKIYMKKLNFILIIIVVSQFLCTSLWFAGNGVISDLIQVFNLDTNALGHITSSVQFGFITGTLLFALLSIADRYSPSKVFFVCAILGALCNIGIILKNNTFISIITLRFFTGFFLAGIYPVGMKIASDYFEKGLGKSLGFLVGALVLGTAFPHLLKNIKGTLPWEFVIYTTSVLAALGGILMLLLIPDGPYRKASQKLQLSAIKTIFKKKDFRAFSFGYFAHMWELYTFWAFVPVMIKMYQENYPMTSFNTSLLCFLIIGIGGLSCILAGFLAQRLSNKTIAFYALLFSCICCIISPIFFAINSQVLFVSFLLFWGIVVIADSPLFSTLVAQNAPVELKGTALTIVTSIGFFISIISLQLINQLQTITNSSIILTILAIGPVLGLIALKRKNKS